MSDSRRITGGGSGDDKGDRHLCAAALLAFILSAGLFLSACGGGGTTEAPGEGNPGDMMPGDGNGGGPPSPPPDPCDDADYTVPDDMNMNTYDVKNSPPDGQDADPDGQGLLICGSELRDVIQGGSGPDTIRALGGDDDLEGREGDDELYGGPGTDTALYWVRSMNVSLEDEEAANDGHGGTDTLVDIENIICEGVLMSGSGNNVIVGDSKDNLLQGCSYITPAVGNNLLVGLGGNDTLRCAPGDNYLDGGPGADTLECTGGGEVNLSLIANGESTHPGDATVKYGKIYEQSIVTVYARLEDGSSDMAGMGNTNIENVLGGNAADTITGDADDNRLDGKGRDDTITGKGGDDTLIGGEGTDTLAGNAGDDTYYADSSDTVTELADEGNDTVYYTDSAAIAHSLSYAEITATDGTAAFAPPNVETVYGTSNADILRAAAGDVKLIGGGGEDTLVGGDGDNTLIGCGGKNIFYSNVGDTTAADANKPYTYPDGAMCATQTPTPTCGANTFVLVYGSDNDDPSVIWSFSTADKLILAGFPPTTTISNVTAAAAANSDLKAAGLSALTMGDNAVWADLEVNDITVAYVRSLNFSSGGTVPSTVLANKLTAADTPLTFDGDYDTGCDEIQ